MLVEENEPSNAVHNVCTLVHDNDSCRPQTTVDSLEGIKVHEHITTDAERNKVSRKRERGRGGSRVGGRGRGRWVGVSEGERKGGRVNVQVHVYWHAVKET